MQAAAFDESGRKPNTGLTEHNQVTKSGYENNQNRTLSTEKRQKLSGILFNASLKVQTIFKD